MSPLAFSRRAALASGIKISNKHPGRGKTAYGFPVFSPSNAHLFFVLPLVLDLLGVLGHKNRPFRFETACFHSFLDRFNFGTPAFGAHLTRKS